MQIKNPLISIIVPAFQCENYINKCILSILKQNYVELEIIIIDDGSRDCTYKLAVEWCKKDKRIRAIHQDNKGVSSTRNRGIQEATGDYIMFLDSDDELIDGIFEVAKDITTQQDIDIVLWGYRCLLNREFLNEYDVIPSVKTGIYEKGAIEDIFWQLYNKNLFHNIGTKLYKRDLIVEHNIKFEEKYSICEDALFCLRVLRQANNMFVLNNPYYLYKLDVNNNSLTKKHHKNYMEGIKSLYELIGDIVDSSGEEYIKSFSSSVDTVLINELKATHQKQNFYKTFDKIVEDKEMYVIVEKAYILYRTKDKIAYYVLNKNKLKAYVFAMFLYKREQIQKSKLVVNLFMQFYRLYKFMFKRKRNG